MGTDHTLFATAAGEVKFEVKGKHNRRFVSIIAA
jgi:large subunit ribosomal protein L27